MHMSTKAGWWWCCWTACSPCLWTGLSAFPCHGQPKNLPLCTKPTPLTLASHWASLSRCILSSTALTQSLLVSALARKRWCLSWGLPPPWTWPACSRSWKLGRWESIVCIFPQVLPGLPGQVHGHLYGGGHAHLCGGSKAGVGDEGVGKVGGGGRGSIGGGEGSLGGGGWDRKGGRGHPSLTKQSSTLMTSHNL